MRGVYRLSCVMYVVVQLARYLLSDLVRDHKLVKRHNGPAHLLAIQHIIIYKLYTTCVGHSMNLRDSVFVYSVPSEASALRGWREGLLQSGISQVCGVHDQCRPNQISKVRESESQDTLLCSSSCVSCGTILRPSSEETRPEICVNHHNQGEA